MKWDVYECDNHHKIVIENDGQDATDTITCPVCDRMLAVYNGSVEWLKDVKEASRSG